MINGFQLKETHIYINKYKTTTPAIKRTQLPLDLSWTCTVDKVQGLSLMSAVVSFDWRIRSRLTKVRCLWL